MVQLSHLCMTTGKTIALTIGTFVSWVMSLFFNMMPMFVIACLPRSNSLFNFMVTVIICSNFGAQEKKICCCFHLFTIYCHEMMELDTMIFVFWMLSFKPAFSPSFTITKKLFRSSLLSAIRVRTPWIVWKDKKKGEVGVKSKAFFCFLLSWLPNSRSWNRDYCAMYDWGDALWWKLNRSDDRNRTKAGEGKKLGIGLGNLVKENVRLSFLCVYAILLQLCWILCNATDHRLPGLSV